LMCGLRPRFSWMTMTCRAAHRRGARPRSSDRRVGMRRAHVARGKPRIVRRDRLGARVVVLEHRQQRRGRGGAARASPRGGRGMRGGPCRHACSDRTS
jgi:hypothetical protein